MNINLLLNNNLFIIDFFNYQMLKKNLESLDTSNLPSDVLIESLDTINLPSDVDKLKNYYNQTIIIKNKNLYTPGDDLKEFFEQKDIYFYTFYDDFSKYASYNYIKNYIEKVDEKKIELDELKRLYQALEIDYIHKNNHINHLYEFYTKYAESIIEEIIMKNKQKKIIIILDDDILIDKELNKYKNLVKNININIGSRKFLKKNYNLEY